MASFLSGDWAPLIAEMQFRNPSHSPGTVPLATEPEDTLAMRCQRIFTLTHDVGAAAAALRAPRHPKPAEPGKMTETFKALNPQVGDEAPPVPENPERNDGEHQYANRRHDLCPPTDLKTPDAMSFKTETVDK